MAVVSIPSPRTLMTCGKLALKHGKRLVAFPDWRQMTERYSGKLSLEWGGLAFEKRYDNNYLTWIEPWEQKPERPEDGTAPHYVTLPPVYAIWVEDTDTDFDATIDLCERHYGVTFNRDSAHRTAWAYAQAEGESESEQVIPGLMCCAYSLQPGDNGYQELGGNLIAVAFSYTGRNLFGFSHGEIDGKPFELFTSAFSLGGFDYADSVTCEGIQRYGADGGKMSFPAQDEEYSKPPVPAYIEVRAINAKFPTSYVVQRSLPSRNFRRYAPGGEGIVTDDDISGAFKSVGGAPFVTATY